MDNLELFSSCDFKIDINTFSNIGACSYVDGSIICFICDNKSIYTYKRIEDEKRIFQIIGIQRNLRYIQHLPVHRAIFLGTDTELVIFDIATEKSKVVHTVEKEILDLVWDSIQSVLVLVDIEYELQVYSFSNSAVDSSFLLTNIFKTKLTSKVPDSVMVGWGSQSTQFKGPKQNKQKGEQTIQKNENNIFNGPPKISWRGNGEQFVINFFKDGLRYIKVFDNQLNPLFESDEYHNLTEHISFMGQGQYIAGCIAEKNVNNLIIFEKNCKLKAISELKETQGSVKKILFNPHMNILGILSKDQQLNSFVDIYLYSNACWYLKQQLYYPPSMDVLDFFWTESNTSLFTICEMVIFTREVVQYHTFRFVTSKSATKAIAAVVNGKQLNIHQFENTVIPPPMKSYIYEHTRPINRVLFQPDKSLCILVDSQFQMCVVSLQKSNATLISSGEAHFNKKPSFLQIDWSSNDHIQAYIQCGDYTDTIEEQEGQNVKLSIIGTNTKPNNALYTEYFLSDHVLDNSQIFLYQARYTLEINNTASNFDIILNACKELCINDNVICSGVTSTLLFKKYLIWTTAAGMLYCMQDKQFNKFTELSNIFVRSIEQGSRIVCCNNVTPPKIVMQLPRGNLETISCKLITIDIIDEMLTKNEWHNVLQIMRMEKINWNVLIDLNPKRFCDHIEDFVKAAKYSNMLTAIVCNFELDGNCFQNLYKNYAMDLSVQSINKKYIIEKILDLLCAKNCVSNLNCIVAIQQKHISLKSALISVKQVYAVDMNKHEVVCNKAVRQLLQQSHFKDVLNESFTLFDLPFLALIYRNSNEDPKVYGPELTNLYNMDELEQRFRLCMKSYNLNSAVKYLLICEKFDEEYKVSFITKNKLEQVAYDSMCNYNSTASDQFQLVSKLFAKRLGIEGKYGEAGFVLKRIGLFEESLHYYQKALEWREVMMLMNKLNYSEEKKNIILEDLACEFIKANNLEDAIIIFEYHLKDYKKAIKFLVEFKAFRRAVNMAKTYAEMDYLNNLIIPSLSSYTNTLSEKVDLLQSRFHGYVNRLQSVRENLQNKFDGRKDDGSLYHNVDDDLFSDTSSVSSGRSSRNTSSSRHSSASSKNRRKEEKKKIDLREGGFYEDIALMRVLHMMYNEVHEFAKEVHDVCLIEELENNEFCKDIHQKLGDLQKYMNKKIEEIWPEVFYKTPLIKDSAVQAITQNKNDLDPKYAIPPSKELLSENWKLKMFS